MNCLNCDKEIKGRSDKKFCDDYCRNAYNNKLNSDQVNLMRNINNILRKNRRILANFLPETEETKKVNKDRLLTSGYNFTYHTHIYQTQKGTIYNFCYDYGYLLLDEEWVLIVCRKEK